MEQSFKYDKEYIDEFDVIAETVFTKIYPLEAAAALKLAGRTTGRCLDLGCGGGHLGLTVARQSEMFITALDINKAAVERTLARAKDWGLADRVTGVVSDVLAMDAVLPPESFDLIVSRGSLGFWGGPEEIRVALGNVWKLLAPGGKTYIGGGLGNAEVRAEIVEKMKVIQPDWPGCLKTNGISSAEYERIARGIDPGAAVTEDDSGRWILMAK